MTYQMILDCEELLELYNEIENLVNKNTELYRIIEDYKDARHSTIEKKGELTINNNKLDLIKAKIERLNIDSSRVNHNFRILSKQLIDKELYNRIFKLSQISLKEAKQLINNI